MRPSIKITPSIVLATVAVVIASSGSAYAASLITSAEIKNDTIRSKDVKDNQLRSSDIKDGSLRARDFGAGVLGGGAQGPKGDTGAAGNGRWLLVDKDGSIIAQSGGFSVNAAYIDLPNTAVDPAPSNARRAAGNVYINANEDLSNNGIAVSIALQNVTDQDGNANTNGRFPSGDANAEFSGEITSTICAVTGIVACAPPGANTRAHFVVSPRNSDGSVTDGITHKRFYVTISGDSTDLTDAGKAIPAKALS